MYREGFMKDQRLRVQEVADLLGVHRNTVLNLEQRGYVKPARDFNNHRRFSLHDAMRLKKLLETTQRSTGVN